MSGHVLFEQKYLSNYLPMFLYLANYVHLFSGDVNYISLFYKKEFLSISSTHFFAETNNRAINHVNDTVIEICLFILGLQLIINRSHSAQLIS
jgi:hypothetical protein